MRHEEQRHEESLWFGSADRPLFGQLCIPAADSCLGAVVLSPPIGRESRLARRALRSLAFRLGEDGYVTLRFDHFATGDSSGSMDDDEIDVTWMDGVDQGVELLRSLGISSVSAVGMRMGATIVGVTASARDLELTSLVMWDPCESGRSYAREQVALGALRRNVHAIGLGESTRMLEYPLSEKVEKTIGRFDLSDVAPRSLAKRLLVVSRDDRTVSKDFRARWDSDQIEWVTTSEQGPLLETELPESVLPTATIEQIRTWLITPESRWSTYSHPPVSRDRVFASGESSSPVRESVVELGPQKMFGIVSEPVGHANGPLLVMVNGINEDHVGPARLWVELLDGGRDLVCGAFDSTSMSWVRARGRRANQIDRSLINPCVSTSVTCCALSIHWTLPTRC